MNVSMEVFPIKKESVDLERFSTDPRFSNLVGSIKQEFITLKNGADCEITDLSISSPNGIIKYEVLPVENNEPDRQEASVRNAVIEDGPTPSESQKPPSEPLADSIVSSDTFSCTQCSYVGINKMGLSLHRRYKHGNAVSLSKHQIRCPHCGIQFSKHRFEIHRKIHVNGPFSCSTKCGFKGTRSEIVKHRRLEHLGSVSVWRRSRNEKKYACTSCQRMFRNSSSLENHEMRHLKRLKSNYSCKYCDKFFNSVWTLEFHVSLKCKGSDKATLSCPFCDKTCSTSQYLEYHKQTKHKKMKCKKCSISFTKEIEYDLHVLSHNKKSCPSSPKCQYCHTTFASNSGLAYHQKKNVCRKNSPPLSRKTYKPYKKSGTESKDEPLIFEHPIIKSEAIDPEVQHLGGNTNELIIKKEKSSKKASKKSYDYVCDFCLKRFTTQYSLKNHKTKNVCQHKVGGTKLSSDPCPGCQEVFESVQFLKRHMKYCVLL